MTRASCIASHPLALSFVVAVACGACGKQPSSQQRALAAQYPTYRALHEAIVTPTCGPRGGVCHNSKQFPDLHTPENMLAIIGQRCNQLTADPAAILDECEAPGDLLVIKSGADAGTRTRIGFVTIDPAATPQYVTLTTHDPIAHDGTQLAFSIVRDTDPKNPLEIPFPSVLTTAAGQASVTVTALATLGQGQRAFFTTPYTPGLDAEVQLGDPNRNGTFGFDLGQALIKPGAPADSFLVQRILGAVPPKMPLANADLTDDQIYALQCWIYQLAPDASNADGPIDYARCPTSF